MDSPNLVARLALLLWIPLSLVAFRRFRPPVAAGLLFLGADMFLPANVSFDLPGFPDLGRYRVTALSAAFACLVFHPRLLLPRRLDRVSLALVSVITFIPLVTALTNSDPLQFGPTRIPALTLYDGLSDVFSRFTAVALPFYIGAALFRTSRDLRWLLQALVWAGLVYSVLILFEVRMAPRLHRMVYGVHPHMFAQHIRFGGYRPMVFMPHGLVVSLFMLWCTLAAAALWRARIRLFGFSSGLIFPFLATITVLCKSVATVVYGMLSLPVLLLARPRLVARVCAIGGIVILAYPVLRTLDLIPTDQMVSLATVVSEERADSLRSRFEHEERLLDRARERLWAGWGSWGRNRVYDPLTGEDLSTTDGYWIITLGSSGVPGFLGAFGLLVYPMVSASWRMRLIRSRSDRILIAALSLVLLVSAIDLLPNAWMRGLRVILGGILVGVLPGIVRSGRSKRGPRAGRITNAEAGPPVPSGSSR